MPYPESVLKHLLEILNKNSHGEAHLVLSESYDTGTGGGSADQIWSTRELMKEWLGDAKQLRDELRKVFPLD